ncbi:MAG: SET domain-containing protein-lysine N-methyltransferase [Henriciella sp.]|uniref:SET domain-containing protein n=1 Tax=Henriciella sp. TaxID=1968823 RepID=UPI003C7137BA
MMLVPCYLAASNIEGLGVYSREPIMKGQLIWRFDPRIDRMISLDSFSDADERLSNFLNRYTYVPHFDRTVCILDGDEGRYMNHSETPNTDFSSIDAGYALREIPADEELICDYREFDMTADHMMASISPLGRQLSLDAVRLMTANSPASANGQLGH